MSHWLEPWPGSAGVTLMPAPYLLRPGLPVSPGRTWAGLAYPSHLCGPKISGPAPPPLFLQVAGRPWRAPRGSVQAHSEAQGPLPAPCPLWPARDALERREGSGTHGRPLGADVTRPPSPFRWPTRPQPRRQRGRGAAGGPRARLRGRGAAGSPRTERRPPGRAGTRSAGPSCASPEDGLAAAGALLRGARGR